MSELAVYIAARGFVTEHHVQDSVPHIRRRLMSNPQGFYSAADLDQILDQPVDYPKTLCIMRGQEFVPQARFKSRAVLEAFVAENQASISFSAIQRHVPTVKRLCDEVEARCGIRTFATVYVTPPGEQGFPVHWDMGSVGVLQVDGHKSWRVYHPVVESLEEIISPRPLTRQECRRDPYIEVTLHPGDGLYIPRGWPHYAVSSPGSPVASEHLSLGLLHDDIPLARVSVYP